jgi:hypothetical protein
MQLKTPTMSLSLMLYPLPALAKMVVAEFSAEITSPSMDTSQPNILRPGNSPEPIISPEPISSPEPVNSPEPIQAPEQSLPIAGLPIGSNIAGQH